MSSVTVKTEGDKVSFRVIEGKPYGVSDTDVTQTLTLNQLTSLPSIPQKHPWHFDKAVRIWIPGAKIWVVFIFESYQERSMGPNEEDVNGPFLPERQYDPPSVMLDDANDSIVHQQRFNPYED